MYTHILVRMFTCIHTHLRPTGSRTPDIRCCVEEKCRTVPVMPLFLQVLLAKVAQLVQYGTFPLHTHIGCRAP